jgi:hypothetical protein
MQEMIDQLADSVGGTHPLSLTALSALANAQGRGGELDAAVKHGQEALVGFRDLYGSDHPYTLTVEANAEIIQSRLASAPTSFPLSHLEEIDFTPLPL